MVKTNSPYSLVRKKGAYLNVPNTIIVDLDGTLADVEHRLHFLKGATKDWDGFFGACSDDRPIWPVINMVNFLSVGMGENGRVLIFSGRSNSVQEKTEAWLSRYVSFDYELVMRAKSDHRPDYLVKKDFTTEMGLTPADILCIIDDRRSVVEMWRREGFTCLQVADHDF